jgi:hypothetical protein
VEKVWAHRECCQETLLADSNTTLLLVLQTSGGRYIEGSITEAEAEFEAGSNVPGIKGPIIHQKTFGKVIERSSITPRIRRKNDI